MVTLAHIMSCDDEVRIFRPSHIDCPGLGDEADAQAVSRAILTSPELDAVDRGPIRPGDNVPLALFAMPIEGRVIDLPGGLVVGNGVDADTCRFLVELPGGKARAAGGPPPPPASIEIGGGARMRLIVADAPGGLALIRVVTGSTTDGEGGAIDHMLSNVYAIRFQ
jgi:hypothetical protein